MNNINSIIRHNHKNVVQSQNGGEIKGERLENFRKKYGYFTKTSNIIKEELKKLGKTRKIEKTRKSDFCAYLNTKSLPYKFLFKNLNSSTGDEISNEFTQYFKLLDEQNDSIIIAMPLFVRFTEGLATNILFYNITKNSDNEYTVDVERFNTYDEIAITEIDDIIDRNLNIELSITDIDINITVKHYKFNTNTFDIDIDDDIIKSLIYSLYFMYKRFENPDDKTLETILNKITANGSRKDIIKFATKLNILKSLKIEAEELEESVDKDIIKKLLERPDLKTKGLLSSMENIFDEMENVYEEFDENAINIEELTEKIEYATKQIIEIYEDKKIFYNDLKITRKNLNADIDNIYSELNKVKDAIIYGVENLILHRGIISTQLQKFEKLSENSEIYEEKKEIFENIKKNLENMVTKQNEYDDKITLLKEQLETKKNEIEEKNKQLLETNKQISTAEDGLSVLKDKLKYYTQQGGDFITNIINKIKRQHSSKILKHNKDLLLRIKNKFGGKKKSIPEKLDKELNDLIDNSSNKKNKKKISEIINNITPIVIKYQDNIEKYHDTLINRETLKKSLQEAFIKLRNLEDVFSETKYKLTDQEDSLNNKIDKIDTIIIQMQNDDKPKDLINKIKLHKKKLVEFLNTKGNYIQKVEKLNDTLIHRKKNLNKSKNDVRNKLNELRNIGSNLDTIKEELETFTEMYGGNILNKSIINTKIKKDKYLEYLVNPIQFFIKGGQNKSNIKNYWIKDETEYIFKNFKFDELKDIAKKWGISNVNKFKNKKDLASALKLILCFKTGLVKDRKNIVVVSFLLDIDISDVSKTDIGEMTKRINNKTTNIPPFSCNKNQQGGAEQIIDSHRFREKYTTNKIAPKIVFHIPMTLELFIKKNENKNPRITEKLKLARIQSISHIKNTNFNKSYDARLLKFVDIDDKFAQEFIKNSWIEGQYLNDSPYVKENGPFPTADYKELNKEKTVHFIENAINSHNSAIALSTEEILGKLKYSSIDFEDLLQQHVNQLVNINSPYLSKFVTNINNEYPQVNVFKPKKPQSGDVNLITKIIKNKRNPTAINRIMNQFKILPDNKDYSRKDKFNRIIIEEKLSNNQKFNPEEEKKAKRDLITGELIGYKINGSQIELIIYNKFHHMNPKSINVYNANLLSHTTNQTIDYILSGGAYDTTTVGVPGIITNITSSKDGIINPNFTTNIPSQKKDSKSKPKIPMVSNETYVSRDPESNDLITKSELAEHLRRIGKIMLHLKKNGDLVKPKTKIGIFNVISDNKGPIVNINSLFSYLKTVQSWAQDYKPDEVLELNTIISYIKEFYKGSQWNAVIKSKKMKVLDNIKKLQQINKNQKDFGDNDIQIPLLNNKIDIFIKDFKKGLIEYEKRYLNDYINTKDIVIFLKTNIKKTKSYLFKKYSNNLKNLFYKKGKFNFQEFPMNKDGVKQIEKFINFVEFLTKNAFTIENDIILVTTIIEQLEIIYHIITNSKYNNISTIKTPLTKNIIDYRDYTTKLNTSTTPITTHADDLTKIIDKLQTGGELTALLTPVTPVALLTPAPAPAPAPAPVTPVALLTPVTSTVLIASPLSKNIDIIKMIEESIEKFKEKKQELIDKYTNSGVEYDDGDSDNDMVLSEFIENYLKDLANPIKNGYKFEGVQHPPYQELIDIWKNLMDTLEQYSKQNTVLSLTNKLKNLFISTKNKKKNFTKLIPKREEEEGQYGGAELTENKLNISNVNELINSLTNSLQSQHRKTLVDISNSSKNNKQITSTIDDRHKQLKLLAQIKRQMSIEDINNSDPNTKKIIPKYLKHLDNIIRENSIIDNEYKISEIVYNIISKNNPDLKLPSYHLISHLQFTIMVGFVNKFEKMWKNDTSFHGNYEIYVNKLLDGIIFEKSGKSSHYDTGDINNNKFLETYYSDFEEYINKNNIGTFEQFLSKTYGRIFSGGEAPKDGYDEFWGKTMYEIGVEWDDLRESPDFNGLYPSIKLFGEASDVLSSFEKSLLFSFIIHAKDLIDELNENTTQYTATQKFNKFIDILPRDTVSYIIMTFDTLNEKNEQTGGGVWKTIVDKLSPTLDGKHDIPGRFYFDKSLDNITYLYIYKNKCEEINKKTSILNPKDKLLVKKLHIPESDFNVLNKNNSVGIKESGELESIMIPASNNELNECAEYRLANTGKSYKNFTIWEFEKKDYKGDFEPIVLWPKSELSILEKDIIGEKRRVLPGQKSSKSNPNQKHYQKKKYKALKHLIEMGDFGDYYQNIVEPDYKQLIKNASSS